MGIFGPSQQQIETAVSAALEKRASIEDPKVPISASNVMELLGWTFGQSASGVNVTLEKALGVPAVWAATNFLSGTLAGLPLHHYRKTDKGRERMKGGLAAILHDAVNDETSSFDWRKYSFDQVFTGGRAYTFIERNAGNKIINFWPLEPNKTTVKRENGRKRYEYRDGRRMHRYEASEIIDIPFMLKEDRLGHRSEGGRSASGPHGNVPERHTGACRRHGAGAQLRRRKRAGGLPRQHRARMGGRGSGLHRLARSGVALFLC